MSTFAHLRDDGTTASGCWIFAGSWTPDGNQMARRDNADPSGLGNTLDWAWAWPLNRRILYNRASADPSGKPWDPKRQMLEWDGTKWTGMDVPDYSTAAPDSDVGPFIMQPEGMGRLFAIDKMAEGPFRNTTSRLKRRSAPTRCIRRWCPTRRRACLKTIWRRWANPTSSLTSAPPTV